MSKYLEIGAGGGAALVLLLAYNFADRNITPLPDLPDRSEAIAAYTAPPPSPLMAAVAEAGSEGKYGLGRPALPEEIAAWDKKVLPDGRGLPAGSGGVLDGEGLFEDYCAICHGDFAEGVDNWPKLAGGQGTLADQDPLKTVGSFWPHLTTTWDYVNRSMPFGNAQTLTADEVYAVVAYILYSNDLVDDDFVLSNENLLDVELPNKDGFIIDDRAETEYAIWSGEPCMENCKESVEITMRAAVLDVTPEETRARRVQEMIRATKPRARDAGGELEADTVMAEAATSEVAAEEPAAAAEAPAAEAEASDETIVEAVAVDPELVAAGEKVFRKCKACHKVGEGAKNGTGPLLNGVIGRAVGAVDGFKYSSALTKLAEVGTVWDAATMSAFLENPKAYAKGTRMSFKGLPNAEDRAAVTAYLATFAE